jgi:hypothetical protein
MASGNQVGVGSINGGRFTTPSNFTDTPPILCGRVYDAILDGDADKSKKFGVPVGVTGAIAFRFLRNGVTDESTPLQTAFCLSPSKRVFPIKNEIVKIVVASTPGATDPSGNNLITYYYTEVVDTWNSPEHNSVPDVNASEGPATGDNFTETGKIARLKHLPGDNVEEGRFGNSVRIGSSNEAVKAPWRGPTGAPLYIIRNGQNANLPKNTTLTYEDINQDGSSLYFLSSQLIDFIPANLNFDSYGQDVDIIEKNNIVTTTASLPITASASPVQADRPADVAIDSAIIKYKIESIPAETEDEVNFLPDKEDPIFYQELEDGVARHIYVGSEAWVSSLSKEPVSTTDMLHENGTGGYTPDFVSYLVHQQGNAGAKAILYYAKRGVIQIPAPNKFSKEDIQNHMVRNVGSDFVGAVTPSKFIQYWKVKLAQRYKEAASITPKFNNLLVKYSTMYNVPLNFVKAVCNTESGFKPESGNNRYKGLFQISMAEFNKVYPGDTDIYNIEKNINVGVKLLRNHLASYSEIINATQ